MGSNKVTKYPDYSFTKSLARVDRTCIWEEGSPNDRLSLKSIGSRRLPVILQQVQGTLHVDLRYCGIGERVPLLASVRASIISGRGTC